MKRRLLIVVIFLLAGAVVNVAVAWGCAAWVPVGGSTLRDYVDGRGSAGSYALLPLLEQVPTKAPGDSWVIASSAWPGERPLPFKAVSGVGVRSETGWAQSAKDLDSAYLRVTRLASSRRIATLTYVDRLVVIWVRGGLPMPSLQGIHAKSKVVLWRQGALPLPGWTKAQFGFVPFRPIWPGLAINTLFYAMFLWLLICGPFVLRRFIRVKRGLCPKCAYPMGESAVCSECGKVQPGRIKVAT